MSSSTTAMQAARRTASFAKHQAVRSAMERSVARAESSSAAGIARSAGVAETFLYRHQKQDCELCREVFGSGPLTFYRHAIEQVVAGQSYRNEREGSSLALSLKADLANSQAANRRLREQIRKLEHRLSVVLGAQAEAALPVGLSGRGLEDTQPPALHERVRELEAELAARDEQIEAVRRVNGELMRQLNGANHDRQ